MAPLQGRHAHRERFSRFFVGGLWGADVRPFYGSMTAIGAVPDGGTVVDAPCGTGVAFRGIAPGQRIRYLAVDQSAANLRRAGEEAQRLGLTQVELIEGDAERLGLEDGTADLFLSYGGLHRCPDPEGAVREMARVTRPGGFVVGTTFVRGERFRQRLLIGRGRRWGPGGTAEDLERWLRASGLQDVSVGGDPVLPVFRARRPARS